MPVRRGRRPARRPIRRRRVWKRKQPSRATVPAVMQPKTYRFKRDIEETLQLNATSPPEGWTADGSGRIYKSLAWALASIGDSSDFTNLYRQYRILGARVKLFFSNTQSTTNSVVNNFTNSQMLVRMAPNQGGEAQVLDLPYWASIQAKKYKTALNGGRPVDIYMPLKQRNEISNGSGGTTATMMRPKFIPTNDTSAGHYGINVAIERVDGQQFSGSNANYQYCKVITTLYFECRGVE